MVENSGDPFTPDQRTTPERFADVINTSSFLEKYSDKDRLTTEAVKTFPTLAYLLGTVSEEPRDKKELPDGSVRNIYFLQEGSGMLGLTSPEDAIEWAGIFNHIAGSIRHTEYLGGIINNLSQEQRQQMEERGYDFTQFDRVGLQNLVDLMFITHAGRRQMDEYNRYGLRDEAHQSGDSYENTRQLLIQNRAPAQFLKLLEIENHADYLTDEGKSGKFSNVVTAMLTLADWTFGQEPNTLEDRFEGLRKTKRAPKEQLDVFEKSALAFKIDLEEVTGKDVVGEMLDTPPTHIEDMVRAAYVEPSGISIKTAFPLYSRAAMPYLGYP